MGRGYTPPPAAQHSVARNAHGHELAEQQWAVKALSGDKVWVQLAGLRKNGQTNRFALKHLMDKPRKAGRSADEKLERRLMHRIDKGGNKAWNPYQGGQSGAKLKQGALLRSEKFGSEGKDTNTVIDLSLIDLDTALVTMANALVAANLPMGEDKHLKIDFGKACVRTAKASGIDDADVAPASISISASSSIDVKACRIGNSSFEVFHCGV